MNTKHIVRPLQVKALNDEGAFEGYGNVFGVVDSYAERVMPGAFEQTIKEHKEAGTMPAMLWQHRTDSPIGVWTSMEEDDHGLKMTGQLCLETQLGKESHALLKAGAIKGLSIGFSLYDGGAKYNGEDEVLELYGIKLWETSVVTFPANELSEVTDIRMRLGAGTYPSVREFERLMRDAGFSASDAKTIVSRGFSALTRDAGDAEIEAALQANIATLRGTIS